MHRFAPPPSTPVCLAAFAGGTPYPTVRRQPMHAGGN